MDEDEKEPNLICKNCGHTHLQSMGWGRPMMLITNMCPECNACKGGFEATKESEIVLLNYLKDKKEKELAQINDRLKKVERAT